MTDHVPTPRPSYGPWTTRLMLAGLPIGILFSLVWIVWFAIPRVLDVPWGGSNVALAAFGLVNATMILGSAASLATALDLALDPSGDAAGQVRLLVGLSENLWGVGGLFFGLWLVPMGLLVLRVGMPRALGWVLVVGGVGYVLSTYVAYLAPGAQPVADALIIPATIGELWVVGYLIYGGVFRSPRAHVADPLPATVGA